MPLVDDHRPAGHPRVRRWCPCCDEFTESAMVGREEGCGQCGTAADGDRWLGDHWASTEGDDWI